MRRRLALWLLGYRAPTLLWKLRGCRNAAEWRWRVFVSETRLWAYRYRDEQAHQVSNGGKLTP